MIADCWLQETIKILEQGELSLTDTTDTATTTLHIEKRDLIF